MAGLNFPAAVVESVKSTGLDGRRLAEMRTALGAGDGATHVAAAEQLHDAVGGLGRFGDLLRFQRELERAGERW